ncbi:MAG: T9SS type A sorting domain-containing protein [Candidatus Eisenbacteria bacterium]|nr:T9SS type A sorting domain-containing protein [Candidatus Eisenbacteria bacterium]
MKTAANVVLRENELGTGSTPRIPGTRSASKKSLFSLKALLSVCLLVPLALMTFERQCFSGTTAPVSEDLLALSSPGMWQRETLAGIDKALDSRSGASSDIIAVYMSPEGGKLRIRVSLLSMTSIASTENSFEKERAGVGLLFDYADGGSDRIPLVAGSASPVLWERSVLLASGGKACYLNEYSPSESQRAPKEQGLTPGASGIFPEKDMAVASFPDDGVSKSARIFVYTTVDGRISDYLLVEPNSILTYEANCAFFHHGNQALAYTNVFHGESGREADSGFDETLEVHQSTGIPGNFHLSGLLQTSAEWDARTGDPQDFNAWLRAGVTAGWAGMGTSAYAQNIMPFSRNEMNDWAVETMTQMTNWRYGYYPRVAWVPERTWLSPSTYPNAGVSDWIGDNWTNHGVYAVILDDNVHGQGYDNHQIHTMSGSSLKVILRDNDFTGKMHAGDGAGAFAILTNLANSGLGPYRIVTYADDWEMAAEIGEWATSMPNAKETYDWMINKCQTESSWVHVWKLADAISNGNFNGSPSMSVTNGSHPSIGGTDGYGGGNNGWYTDWAAYIPWVNGGDGYGNCDARGGNCKNFGTIWNDAYNALMAAPNNSISQAGWYVLMTNLFETAWHDYMGGPISGWEMKHSTHIKNASTYAEASRWAGGLYANPTGAYLSDIDNDGYQELIMYNNRILAVFESVGGRAVNVFAKGSGYCYPVIGVDNVYWYGTEADYNDGNHVGALSDVGPNYQNDDYTMAVSSGSGNTVSATFSHSGVTKKVSLTLGDPYLDVIYQVGGNTQYIQTGFSPDLVDLIWNARLDRIWDPGVAYMGQRNPNTGATCTYVTGTGGASHNKEISGRIMNGDEIRGTEAFEFFVFGGYTPTPDPQGNIAMLDSLALILTDRVPPQVVTSNYFPGTDVLTVGFTETVSKSIVNITGFAFDDDHDGVAEARLTSGSTVTNPANARVLTIQLSSSDAAAFEALTRDSLLLLMDQNTVVDMRGNGNAQVTNLDMKRIYFGAQTSITIDGRIDFAEWDKCKMIVPDSLDSQWTSSNEIDALYATWDSTYLYLALDGIVYANSWLIYLDTDPGGPLGETDLRNINYWDRNALFTAPGFRADFQYGAYQHQGQWDSNSFYSIESPTVAVDSTRAIICAFDPKHNFGQAGGSELAIPWNVLYGLGAGRVPANCGVSIVASLAWDEGDLGGDSAPSNVSATLPTVDHVFTFTVDSNGDGYPDPIDRTGPQITNAAGTNDTTVTVTFNEPLDETSAETTSNYTIYETVIPSNTIQVKLATLLGDKKTVSLRTGRQSAVNYTVSVSGVKDATCNANQIIPNSTFQFSGYTSVSLPGNLVDSRVPVLFQNFPNPVQNGTLIVFHSPLDLRVEKAIVRIVSPTGRLIRELESNVSGSGICSVSWDGRDSSGKLCPSGLYIYTLKLGNFVQTKRLVVVR